MSIDFLRDGKSFKIDGLLLRLNEFADVEVCGWSNFTIIENITKEIALRELTEIKSAFLEILKGSPELQILIHDKATIYKLFFDDYGKGSVGMCYEKDGVLTWGLSLK